MKGIVSAAGTLALVVACSSSSTSAPACDDTPLPAAGKDCAVAGLYSVLEAPRCSACQGGERTMNPVDVQVDQGNVTIAFDSQDNRTEHVTIKSTCTLSGCDCKGANGLHVVFTNTEWFAEGIVEEVMVSSGQPSCVGQYWHGTRNP